MQKRTVDSLLYGSIVVFHSWCPSTFSGRPTGWPRNSKIVFDLKCGPLSLQNSAVDRTLKDHLEWLQGRLETLSSQIMECANREQANHLQSEIAPLSWRLPTTKRH